MIIVKYLKSSFFLVLYIATVATAGTFITSPSLEHIKISEENIYEYSEFWPFRVSLTDDYIPDGRSAVLRQKTKGVLIRVEQDTNPIIDFGRFGVHKVPVGKTDLLVQANALSSGKTTAQDPNYAMLIGLRLTNGIGQIGYIGTGRHPYYLTVYVDEDIERLSSLSQAFQQHLELLKSKGVLIHIIPVLEERMSDFEYGEILRETDFEHPFMPIFLAKAYAPVLMHEPTSNNLPVLALVDAHGKLHHRSETKVGSGMNRRLEQIMTLVASFDEFEGGRLLVEPDSEAAVSGSP